MSPSVLRCTGGLLSYSLHFLFSTFLIFYISYFLHFLFSTFPIFYISYFLHFLFSYNLLSADDVDAVLGLAEALAGEVVDVAIFHHATSVFQ